MTIYLISLEYDKYSFSKSYADFNPPNLAPRPPSAPRPPDGALPLPINLFVFAYGAPLP